MSESARPEVILPQVGRAPQARDEAAKDVNVSPSLVQFAKKVLDDGATELVTAVERGSVAVSTAAVIASESKERQREIVAKGEKEIYEIKYPETRHGGDRKSPEAKSSGNSCHSIPSFSKDTAAKTNLSERSADLGTYFAPSCPAEASWRGG